MKKMKSIKEFQNENPNLEFHNQEFVSGGFGAESLTHRDRNTMDNWNCSDIERQMMYDGQPCSEWFLIFKEY